MAAPAEDFQALAGRLLRDARNVVPPACPTDEEGPRETEAWFHAAQTTAMFDFVRRAGLDPEAFFFRPRRPTMNIVFRIVPAAKTNIRWPQANAICAAA